jgi:uncharacterized heparinase superfamily protein
MSGAGDGWGWFRDGVEALTFGNPIYNMLLGGRTVASLKAVPLDPWPGDAARGAALLEGEFQFGGQTLELSGSPMAESFWSPPAANPVWFSALHDFHWLRDLRALGGDEARRYARALVYGWFYCYATWTGETWTPALTGNRIANWIGLHDFFCASAEEGFRACVFDSLARQTRHLARVVPGRVHGLASVPALKGIAYGSLCLPEGGQLLDQVRRTLDRELPGLILADGGMIERRPSGQLRLLRDLIDVRAAFRAARAEQPALLQATIDRMTPLLRFFRHGDGALALFNGGQEESPALIDTVLNQADARSRPLRSAPQSGFERLHGGRALVIADTGAPAPRGADRFAHAGLLSFEFSVGKERLIVNCGADANPASSWRAALAATAAHSTLTVSETNTAEVLAGGGIGRRPEKVSCEREETEDEITLSLCHTGYEPNFGLIHRRYLALDQHGDGLHGEDVIEPAPDRQPDPRPFAIRFHLHPGIQVAPRDGENAMILHLPSGSAWRFAAEGATLEAGDSIYLGDGTLRPSLQLVLAGETTAAPLSITWSLRREKLKG